MAPKRDEIVRQYFKQVLKGPKKVIYSKCLTNKHDKIDIDAEKERENGIEKENLDLQCGITLSGEKVSNMKYHLKSIHPKIYQHFLTRESVKNIESNSSVQKEAVGIGNGIKEQKQTEQSTSATATTSSHPPSHSSQTGRIEKKPHKVVNRISNFYGSAKRIRTSIPVSRAMLIRSLLSKVTIDGRPFSSLNDISYSMFAQPAMTALNIRYDNKNICDLIAKAAQNIKEKLRKDMEGLLICVKVDCATRKKKSFIGINVQLVKNGRIVVYTLAVKEVTVRHTGDNLKTIILQELESYGILPKHIYTITSDNGANMVKSVKLIEEEQIKDTIEEMELEDDEDEEYEINVNLMENIYNAKWTSDRIMSIRCAAHTLQLCVTDTLKKSWLIEENAAPEIAESIETYTGVIAKARKVVVELNTQNVIVLLHDQNLKKPSLDVLTRWSSTYIMLSGLLPLKQFCESCVKHGNNKLKLTEEEWNLVEEIRLSLEPSYFATKKLQSKSNTLTDVYKIWNICQMSTAEIGTAFSNELVGNMIKRRDTIMENVVMLSAIYLDPRFSFELTDEEKQKAITHICTIQARILELQQEKQILSMSSSDTDFITDDDEDARYERHLRVKHRHQKEQSISKPNFKNALSSFANNMKRLPIKTNILVFWQEDQCYNELHKVAEVILSVPGTQVSVEQLFSQLKFIYSELRNLKSVNTNNILIVRCNFELLDDFISNY